MPSAPSSPPPQWPPSRGMVSTNSRFLSLLLLVRVLLLLHHFSWYLLLSPDSFIKPRRVTFGIKNLTLSFPRDHRVAFGAGVAASPTASHLRVSLVWARSALSLAHSWQGVVGM